MPKFALRNLQMVWFHHLNNASMCLIQINILWVRSIDSLAIDLQLQAGKRKLLLESAWIRFGADWILAQSLIDEVFLFEYVGHVAVTWRGSSDAQIPFAW